MKATIKKEQSEFFRNWALEHWDLVNRLAQRRFSDDVLAEEAALYVLEQLSRDNWSCLSGYRGRARLKTFFSTVVYNQLEDFARKRFGRVRPPQWLKKLGGIWLLLYRLLCHERYSFTDALYLAADRHRHLPEDRIEQMAERILGEIPSCGKTQLSEDRFDDNVLNQAKEQEHISQQAGLELQQREQFLAGLYCLLLGDRHDSLKLQALTKATTIPIVLTSDDRLLLKLCHHDGLSVAEAGRMVGLNRFQAHGKLRRLYKKIRESFEAGGCSEEIALLLEPDSDTF